MEPKWQCSAHREVGNCLFVLDLIGLLLACCRIELLEDRCMLDFSHPGLLHTEADFNRMAEKVAAHAEPWMSGWQALTSNGYAQLGTDPRPLQTVIRGGEGQNFNQMVIDIQRAYAHRSSLEGVGQHGLRRQGGRVLERLAVHNDHADRQCRSIPGSWHLSGIYGYEWANVAEIMRTYEGWSQQDADHFGDWLVEHFYSLNHQFLTTHNDAAITNYWANWDLCNVASVMAIGVYTDDQAMYDEAVNYSHDGGGNGTLDRFVYYVHDGNLGQWQEAGRDQGHTVFGVSLVGPIMQMAWNQGLDLYSYDNNRFLAGAEYVAKYNLGYDVPFEQYSWGTGQNGTLQTQTVVSSAGRGNTAPGYELVYNHYVNLLGIDAPYTEQRIASLFPEGASGNGDQFGFGTLTYTLDPFPASQSKPSGLTAVNYEESVKLNWWGAVYADSYNVYRATSETGALYSGRLGHNRTADLYRPRDAGRRILLQGERRHRRERNRFFQHGTNSQGAAAYCAPAIRRSFRNDRRRQHGQWRNWYA